MAFRHAEHSCKTGRKEEKQEERKEGRERGKMKGMRNTILKKKIDEEPNLEEIQRNKSRFLESSSCYRRP